MPSTLITKYGSGAPLASDLVRGELAVDTENGRLYTEDSGGSVIEIGLNPSGNVDVTGTVTTTGSVGVGTSSVDSLLHLSASSGPELRIENTDTALTEGQVVGSLVFEQNDSTAGGVGISGRIQMRSADRPDTGTYFGTAADMDFLVSGDSSGAASDGATKTAMTIRAGTGNVGIGTSNPQSELHIAASQADIRLEDNSGTSNYADITYTDGRLILSSDEGNVVGASTIEFQVDGSEAMRIDASGNVGIGTTSPYGLTHWQDSSTVNLIGTNSGADGQTDTTVLSLIGQARSYGNNIAKLASIDFKTDATSWFKGNITFNVANSDGTNPALTPLEAMRIDSNGNLLVGKIADDNTTNGFVLDGNGTLNIVRSSQYLARLNRTTTDGEILRFEKDGTEVGSIGTNSSYLVIGSPVGTDAYLLIGNDLIHPATSTGASKDASIDIGGSSNRFKDLFLSGKVITGGNTTSNEGTISFVADSERCVITGGYDTGGGGILKFFTDSTGGTNVQRMSINNAGTVAIVGALSKGSGSFKIDHPLPEKTETHHLVHSFVESPQADNIYRGKVDLVDGSATVNIDTVSGMTEGTFVLLNTNTQCFTSNESGWTAVKGSVSGNILTITAQEACSDTISWLVIGERHDQHMLDTDWTDENGKVIVEPLKQEAA